MLAGTQGYGLLRHTNVTFERLSLSGDRKLSVHVGGNTTVGESKLDKWEKRGERYKDLTPYEWLRRDSTEASPKVPLVTGAHLWYTNPPTAEYAESMLKLHTLWDRKTMPVPKGEQAIAAFQEWTRERANDEAPSIRGPCPAYIRLEIAKYKRGKRDDTYISVDGDGYDYEDAGEPEWLDLMGASYEGDGILGDFSHDNFSTRADFDQCRHSVPQHERRSDYADEASVAAMRSPGRWWKVQLDKAEREQAQRRAKLNLATDDPRTASLEQQGAIVLLLHTLYHMHNEPGLQIERHAELVALKLQALGRRVLLLGRPGAGKSYVLRCIATLTRMVVNAQDAAKIGAPTGIAAFVAGGSTWHTLAGIPVGSKFNKSFSAQGGSIKLQQALAKLVALLGDETSMTGRILFGWIAHKCAAPAFPLPASLSAHCSHLPTSAPLTLPVRPTRLRVNVAKGEGADEPDAGMHLPFWLQAGDFDQLPPVLDTSLLNNDCKSANSNHGRAVFKLFEKDVIVLTAPKRQKTGESKLLDHIDSMRRGAAAKEYDQDFVESRTLVNLPPAERALYTFPGQGTLCGYYTWDEAWQRNKAMLGMLNAGYTLPGGVHIEGVPVYKLTSTNSGRCAKSAGVKLYMGIVMSTYVARGLQIRLTVNLYSEFGQQWGLVNGAVGTVVEVLYTTPEAAAAGAEIPLVIAEFETYCGPAFCAARPKLVLLPPVEKQGDCSHGCKRYGPCFRMAEGTTFHSLQGIGAGTTEPPQQVKRVGIELGDVSCEHRARGGSIVAQSRPVTQRDFCYMSPVAGSRLAAIGRDKQSVEMRQKTERLAQNQSADAAALLSKGFYEPLLEWAIAFAKAKHGIDPPWEQRADVS